MYVFIKDIIEETNSYWHVQFFFDKKQANFEHILYPLHIKNKEKKIIFKKNEQQQEDLSEAIMKNRFKGV